jgi:hypothetical protein
MMGDAPGGDFVRPLAKPGRPYEPVCGVLITSDPKLEIGG